MGQTPEDLELDEEYALSPEDNLPARVVGDWSKDKHYYLKRYIEIFSNGMHKKWASRTYIDLYSGPGVCLTRQSRELFDGSPLLALKVQHPFTDYHFVDMNPQAISALKKRCAPFAGKTRLNFYQQDCALAVKEIAAQVNSNSLSLAFLDPTGLDLRFDTIRTLTTGKKMDLIINFPHGTAIKRNMEKWYKKDRSKPDEFFAGDEWRTIYEKKSVSDMKRLTDGLLDLYGKKLAEIGYAMSPSDAVVIKNRKESPLYALIFASKDPLGNKFWKEIKKIESQGQRSLF